MFEESDARLTATIVIAEKNWPEMNDNIPFESLPKPTYVELVISKGAISFSSMNEPVKIIILRSV